MRFSERSSLCLNELGLGSDSFKADVQMLS